MVEALLAWERRKTSPADLHGCLRGLSLYLVGDAENDSAAGAKMQVSCISLMSSTTMETKLESFPAQHQEGLNAGGRG